LGAQLAGSRRRLPFCFEVVIPEKPWQPPFALGNPDNCLFFSRVLALTLSQIRGP